MKYLFTPAVFLVCFLMSACQDEPTDFLIESDIIRCQAGPTGDVCDALESFLKDLDNGTCRALKFTDLERKILGPKVLVTNGSSELTLTCPNATGPVDRVRWTTPCPMHRHCNTTGQVCTFRPRLQDDFKNVTCKPYAPNGTEYFLAYYTINLEYPPQSNPSIETKPRGLKSLKAGDDVECTVDGGKPPVTNVTLTCVPRQDQILGGNSGDGNKVSSLITVNTELTMTCTCSAFWAPDPHLYTNVTRRDFNLQTSRQPASKASGLVVAAMTFVIVFVI